MRITEEEFLKADYLPILIKNKTKKYPFIVYDMNAHPLARVWKSQRKNIVYCVIKKRYYFLINDYEGNEDEYTVNHFKAMINFIRNTSITSKGFIFRALMAFVFLILVLFITRVLFDYKVVSDNIFFEIIQYSLILIAAVSFTHYYVNMTEQKQMSKYVKKNVNNEKISSLEESEGEENG